MNETLSIVFSKDRPMQLRATIDSFLLHCVDVNNIDIIVYFKATSDNIKKQYNKLNVLYEGVTFVEELNFEKDVRDILHRYKFLLMQVDDNIWVRECDIGKAIDVVENNNEVIGFSYRLSPALKIHYLTGRKINIPKSVEIDGSLKYNWIGGGHEFGYSLEVTGTLYRATDIFKAIKGKRFVNPNSFERALSKARKSFNGKPYLICQKELSVFMAPVNLVQDCTKNKSGTSNGYSVDALALKFNDGYKIDIEKFVDFDTDACGNEVKFNFIKENSVNYLPHHKDGGFLRQAYE